MRIAVSIMMALIISSCVSIPTISPMSVHNLGTKPEKDLITTVELGNSIYSEYVLAALKKEPKKAEQKRCKKGNFLR